VKKKAASKAKPKNLRAKTLSAKQATSVKGGKGTDQTSPNLFLNCATGDHLKKVY
jgi:hypothetical protein